MYGSTSCCISHWPKQYGEGPYFTAHSVVTLQPIWITLDMYNYTPQATHRPKFDFDLTTWVVWANSQFATVSGVFLPSFLPFLTFFGSPTSHAGGSIVTVLCLVDVLCAKGVHFGVRIFSFHIFTYFHQKQSKLSSK